MGCGIAIIKYLVILFNLVFALIGLTFVVVGVLYKFQFDVIHETIDLSEYGITPTILIALGTVVFLISFFGCCGAIKESKCMLITYGVLLLIIFLIQLVVGVLSFIVLNNINEKMNTTQKIEDIFQNYTISEKTQKNVDELQEFFECCGVDGPTYWKDNIPSSCCRGMKSPCLMTDSALYTDGCGQEVVEQIVLIFRTVAFVVIGIGIIEIFGAIFAFYLTSSIQNSYRRGTFA